jgi:aspartyl-tRNA(Asn)/glutamyl-tRNA(Gln) amidotransferase subunit A
MSPCLDAVGTVSAIRAGTTTATRTCEDALASARASDLGCFTEILTERAKREAGRIDAALAAGAEVGALAGVPFAIKDLYDLRGVVTRSGSTINLDRPPAAADADAVQRLVSAGAVPVGTTVMDEFAYGFTTENEHYGPARNPHDPGRVAGGSSGGSAAAVAARIVPLALGSDTNGSIRVPAALCGILGLRATSRAISTAGVEPFAPSFDEVGVFARSARDLAAVTEILTGQSVVTPAARSARLRVGSAAGYFRRGADHEVLRCVAHLASVIGVEHDFDIPGAAEARAAAMVITAAEGAQHHLEQLRTRPQDFDNMTRCRFLAGALVPASWYLAGQRFRRWFREQLLAVFEHIDVLLTPTVPFRAPLIGQREALVDGETVLTQPYLGAFTQPISFAGVPAMSVPCGTVEGLPVGVQLVAAPGCEAALLAIAQRIEDALDPWPGVR